MTDTPESLFLISQARIALLMHLVRVLVRERASAAGLTADDMLLRAQEIKSFFEGQNMSVRGDAYMSAAIDDFFNVLVSDMRKDSGN
jgi:hypothetical protein